MTLAGRSVFFLCSCLILFRYAVIVNATAIYVGFLDVRFCPYVMGS